NLLDLRQRQQALKSRTQVLEHQLVSGAHEMEQRELELLVRLAKLASRREGADLRIFERISVLSELLARAMGWDERQSRELRHASQLHDIGNIGIPDAILLQPGPLSEEQRRVVEQHPRLGHEVLQDGSGLLHLGAEIALAHQERWDGSGYPARLHGDNIPQSARIVAVADVLDALLSDRPYRKSWSLDAALKHIRSHAGTLFDPQVVQALDASEAEVVATHRSFEST
ncbi:MAG: HD-GYP domain-containing protein, partial [Arenimonas sp.]